MPVIVWEASPSPHVAFKLMMRLYVLVFAWELRLGFPICKPHTCVCGAIVDERDLHGLSCMRGIGRLSRHNHINDIMCRAFASAGMLTVKEPTGLIPGTDLCPDGLTLIPWSSGKCLTWDVTVIDTIAPSNLNHSIHVARSAAEVVVEFKISNIFQTLQISSICPICIWDAWVYMSSSIRPDNGAQQADIGAIQRVMRRGLLVLETLCRSPAWQRRSFP